MVAADTDVVVRLVTQDHPAQAARAAAIFRSGPVHIAKTVMLETARVLGYAYDLDEGALARVLRGVAGRPNVELEDARAVADALAALEQRLDFADALQLASSGGATQFVTFDRRLARRARGAAKIEVVAA